jgi:hypothetical protein
MKRGKSSSLMEELMKMARGNDRDARERLESLMRDFRRIAGRLHSVGGVASEKRAFRCVEGCDALPARVVIAAAEKKEFVGLQRPAVALEASDDRLRQHARAFIVVAEDGMRF